MKAYRNMIKVKKFGNIEIQRQTFYQHKEPISIKNLYINKLVVSYKVPFGKKDWNIVLASKILKRLDLYIYIFLPKMSASKKGFDKPKYVFFFLIKDDKMKIVMKFGENWKISSKNNLIVNEYIMKNI